MTTAAAVTESSNRSAFWRSPYLAPLTTLVILALRALAIFLHVTLLNRGHASLTATVLERSPLLLSIAIAIAGGVLVNFAQKLDHQRRKLARSNAQLERANLALAAEALKARETEARFQMLFSVNPYPMWVYDCDTLQFLQVNDAAVEQYGYTREEFLSMTAKDIRPAEDIPRLVDVVAKPGAGLDRRGVWRHRRKDGSELFAEVTIFKFQTENGSREVVLAHDVTKRVQAEEALRQSQQTLQSLVNSAPFGICRISLLNDRFETVNDSLCRILGGYTRDEVLQRKISSEIYADAGEHLRFVDVLRRMQTLHAHETTLIRKDGTHLRVRLWGVLVPDATGELNRFEGYIEDITEQSTLEQQVRQAQRLEAVGRLAGGIAHDFNNILVVIKLSTELMLGQITPESPLTKPLLQVLSAADRAAALTRQLLAFGRQQVMQARVININSVVSDISHLLQRIIGEDIHLLTSLSDDLQNTRLDPDQLGQVILNLAVNARDAMPGGGTLHIETANVRLDDAYTRTHPPVQPGPYVMLAVSDTGTGIDKAILPRIFDPFFTTKELGKGTGLGLSIVYGIVKQIGGYIWVYSEPGEGTTFKLYFPLALGIPETSSPPAPEVSRTSGQTVLLVEDEAVIRHNVRECLQQLGYHVIEAEDGMAGLAACEAQHGAIDLVLTDLIMPRLNGQDMAHELSLRYPTVGVLFMSGYTEDNATHRDILQNGSIFLQKPFSVADLSRTVQRSLALRAVRLASDSARAAQHLSYTH